MDLLRYNFICHECEQEFYTYVNRIHYQDFISREKDIKDIFNSYPFNYQSLFSHGLCNKCQNKLFDTHIDNYCLHTNTNDIDDSNLYNKINDLSEGVL